MELKYTKSFDKLYKKLDKKNQTKFDEKVLIFIQNPFDHSLNNHPLNGEYKGFRSINITGDYRAIFKENEDGTYEFIEFVYIGTHSQLY